MNPKRLSFIVAGLFALQCAGQDVNTLVNQGRAFLGAQDLTNANARFATAVALSPTHETANALYAITRLLHLPSQPPIDLFLTRLGVSSTNRNVYHWETSVPEDTNGVPYAPAAGVNAGEALVVLRTNVLPEITGAELNLSCIASSNFTLELTSSETTTTDTTLDYGDILMLRALLHGAEFMVYTLNAQNMDVQLSALRALYEREQLSIGQVLQDHPYLLTFATTNDLAAAQAAFQSAVDLYLKASTFIRNRPEGLVRLFNWDTNQVDRELEFRQTLGDITNSFNGPVILTANTNYTVFVANFVNGTTSLRELLPEFRGQRFLLGSLPDVTFGGVFFGLNPQEVDDYLSRVFQTMPSLGFFSHLVQGPFQLILHMTKNRGYEIQASTNLLDWESVSVFFANTNLLAFNDASLAMMPHRFYRVIDRTENMPPPANDSFANPTIIPGTGVPIAGYNVNATRESGEPTMEWEWAAFTVWYSWTAPFNGPVAVAVNFPENHSFYTIIGVFEGSTLSSLVQVSGGFDQSTFTAVAGTTYRIAIGGTEYSLGDRTGPFEIAVIRPPAVSFSSPADGAIFQAPANVLISGGFTPGDGPIQGFSVGIYDVESNWQVLDIPLSSGVFSHWLTNVPPGEYTLSAFIEDNLRLHGYANTSFRVPSPNDDFTNRIPIIGNLPLVFTGSNRGSSVETNEPLHNGYYVYPNSVWWTWTPTNSETVAIACLGTQAFPWGTDPFGTTLAVYTGDALSDLLQVTNNRGDPSHVTFRATAGTTYQIAVSSYSTTGDLRLALASRPSPNDAFANRIVLEGTASSASGWNVEASREPDEPYHFGSTGGKSLWWTWTAPANGSVAISTEGSSFDTILAAYTGFSIGDLTHVASDDDSGSGLTSRISFNVFTGTVYQIAVAGGYGQDSGIVSLALTFTQSAAPPNK